MQPERSEIAGQPQKPYEANDKAPRFYRPELDVLRFFAFLLVFVSHTWPESASTLLARSGVPARFISGAAASGALGVFVFFMLSSYLITELLLREKLTTHTIHIKSYYVRRILRIWPLYFLFLGVSFALGPLTPAYAMPGRELASMLLLSGNWYFGHHGWGTSFTSHLWSISVEEQFYLIWPLFLKLGTRATLRAGCSVLMAISFLSIAILGWHGRLANPAVFTNSFVVFGLFALGGIAALAMKGRIPKLHPVFRLLLLALGITLFYNATQTYKIHNVEAVSVANLLLGYALIDIGCLAILFSFLGLRIPSWGNVLVYLGKISYGLYVFHLACLALVWWFKRDVLHKENWPLTLPLIFLLTVLSASLSYRFIETPFLRLKERFVIVKSRRV